MRSLLLASATILLSTGIACAQTASPTPPPTGAVGEPMAQPGAPAGKTAPNPASTKMTSTSATPSYNGQNAVTNGQSQSTQTGMMGQKASASGEGVSGSHHWAYGAMPENGDARTYLRIARMDIQHHNRSGADEALSRAETRVLTRSVPASGSMTDDSPMITAIENARQAVNAGNYHEAAMDTDMAMHHHMSAGMGMGSDVTDSSSSSSMGSEPSPHAQENGNNPNASVPGDGTGAPGMNAGASSGAQQ